MSEIKNKIIFYRKIFYMVAFLLIFFLMAMGNLRNVKADYEDPNDAWTNFSNIPVSVSSGCGAQSVYQHCTFYANFWNPNGNIKFRSVSVTLKRNGSTVFSHTEWSSDNNHYFNWCHIGIYLEDAGTYTVEKSATTLSGETLNWDAGSLTVNPIADCPSNLSLSSSNVSLDMTGTKNHGVTAKVTGIMPNHYAMRYKSSDSSVVSCSWNDWYDSDSDGENDSCILTVTGKAGGTATITVSFVETKTDTVITSKTFKVNVGPNYTVSYHANGGTGAPSSQTKYYNKTLTLSSSKPTRADYTFKGWSASSSASSPSYAAGDSYTLNSSKTLYAVWERNPSAPTVTSPSAISVKSGNSASFSVNASGGYPSSYTYQWYYATSQNGMGTKIGGATLYSYSISNTTANMDGRYYYCIVSNGQYDVASGRARLTVYSPPNVTVPASSPKNVKEGNSVSFSVDASGGNPSNYTYQWYYATSQNGTGTRVGGAASSSYNISSATAGMDGRYYYCIVSNGQYDVTSIKVKLNVEKENKPSEGGDDGENPTNPPEGGDKNEPSKPPASGGGTAPALKEQKITASSYTKTYGSKPFSLNARTNGDGKLTYRITNHSKAVTVSADGKITVKGCGTAKIAIAASQTANYKAASKTIIVKVVPRTPAMPQASSPSRRKMSIKWKQDKTVTAYELQISQKSNFKSQTIKRYYNYKKTKVSVTGFPSGKTYYVRMRCYKTLGKNKYYGNWSKVRKVKVR